MEDLNMGPHKKKDKFKAKKLGSKSMILLAVLVFVSVCTIAIYFYIHQLENTFLNNTVFYMNEIAEHDMKSVDEEIDNQWSRLETIGKKLSLQHYIDSVNVQQFLNLETEATGFKELTLIDSNGKSYSSNFVVTDISQTDWGSKFLKDKEQFAIRSQSKENFVVLYSNLMYGVPIKPVEINGITYIGVVGKYSIDSVKDSLKVNFFNGEGIAEVVSRDGTVITTDITQRGISLENILNNLKDATISRNESYEKIKECLSSGESFDTVYKLDGETYIMSSKPMKNADWMVVVTVPYSVSSSQTMMFLKMTAVLLIILCIIIAIILSFSFISFKRTMILKNSKEIFYRERLFNLLTNHTDDVFIIQDFEKNTTNFISENVVRILGVSPKVGEKPDISFLDKENLNYLLENFQNFKTENNHEHVELEFEWHMPKTNEKKWMHMSVYHVVSDFTGKEEACLIIVISDYTQVKDNQLILENAMKQAQDAAKSKTLFLSNMSHEMRTPLNGIVGCISMMKSHMDDHMLLEKYLMKAQSTSDYLISLVSDILDMSKIESHKMTLEERNVSIKEICTNIDTIFRSQMEMKNVEFCMTLDNPIYMIRGDEVRIQQILINLLGNALKFTNEGGKVTLHIYQESLSNNMIKTHFSVSDNGIGMSKSFMDRIWQPFEQERLDNARLHGGTGLGLAISYELATLMNGSISVDSKLNEGSTFYVEITSLKVSQDELDNAEEIASLDNTTQLVGYRILVAEDNDLNREILIALLSEMGATVIEATNGAEAVERFKESKEHEIDVILMDMQMPVMDGCEAASSIRSLQRNDAADVKIIACTANAFQEDIDRAKQSGMNEHIAKPLDIHKLLKVLHDLQEGKQNEK